MMKPLSAIAAVLVATAVVAPTVGQAQETSSARVSYADLNLANDVAQQTLRGRIKAAARTLCDARANPLELALVQQSATCFKGAIASAQPGYDAAVAAARRGSVTVLDGAALIVTAQ